MEKIIRIHDLQTAWKDLNVSGMVYYLTRIILAYTGLLVLVDESRTRKNHSLLRTLGFSTDHILWVEVPDGATLVETLMTDPHLDFLVEKVRAGYKLQFFDVTEYEYRLVQRIIQRLGYGSWSSITVNNSYIPERGETARAELNDKALFRKWMAESEFDIPFLRHFSCRSINDLFKNLDIVDEWDTDEFLVRYPRSASGDETYLVPKAGIINAYLMLKRAGIDVLIEECATGFKPVSILFDITDSGIEELGQSLQLEVNRVHMGNIALPQFDKGGDFSAEARRKLSEIGRQIVQEFQRRGARGLLGIDALLFKNGRITISEVNARVSATWYLYQVQKKLEEQGYQEKYILMSNIYGKASEKEQFSDKWPMTFDELRAKLSEELFNRKTGTGVLPYLTALLTNAEGKFAIICIGNNREEVEQIYLRVCESIGAYTPKIYKVEPKGTAKTAL